MHAILNTFRSTTQLFLLFNFKLSCFRFYNEKKRVKIQKHNKKWMQSVIFTYFFAHVLVSLNDWILSKSKKEFFFSFFSSEFSVIVIFIKFGVELEILLFQLSKVLNVARQKMESLCISLSGCVGTIHLNIHRGSWFDKLWVLVKTDSISKAGKVSNKASGNNSKAHLSVFLVFFVLCLKRILKYYKFVKIRPFYTRCAKIFNQNYSKLYFV